MISKFRRATSSRGSSGKFYGLIAVFLLALVSGSPSQAAQLLTIEPAEPEVASCLAFGAGPGGLGGGSPGFPDTSPYMGFIYQNIPPFTVVAANAMFISTSTSFSLPRSKLRMSPISRSKAGIFL